MFGTDRVFRKDGDVQGAGPKKIFTKEEDNRFYESHWQYLETNRLVEPIHRIGAFHVVSKVVIKYLYPVRCGDVLCIETNIAWRSSTCFRVDQRAYINASGKTAIKAVITNVFVDAQGRPQAISSEMLNAPNMARPVLCRF